LATENLEITEPLPEVLGTESGISPATDTAETITGTEEATSTTIGEVPAVIEESATTTEGGGILEQIDEIINNIIEEIISGGAETMPAEGDATGTEEVITPEITENVENSEAPVIEEVPAVEEQVIAVPEVTVEVPADPPAPETGGQAVTE
jgi:hypothetical protein